MSENERPAYGVSAPALGQLLLMQSVMDSLPDEEAILSFVCRGLLDLPGVAGVKYNDNSCEDDGGATVCFPMSSNNSRNGELCLKVDGKEAFQPYEPYVKNFCVMLAVILEERRQRRIEEIYKIELEKRVEERTSQLRKEVEERKRAEEEILFKNALLKAQAEASIDGILIVDGDGKAILFNDRFVEIWGIPEEILNTKDDNAMLRHFLDMLKAPDAFIEKGKSLYERKEMTSRDEIEFKDGRTIDRYSAPVADAAGGNYGRVWYFRDITERKLAEEESKNLQAQLFQSQKMEAVGQLAGGMAHDFNNMLGVILSAAELARLDIPGDSPVLEELRTIIDSVIIARDLTMKLLTFARRDKISVAGAEAGNIIENLKGMLSRTIPKSVELSISVKDKCVINCDRNQIHQALLNVCNNAVDAMPGGGRLAIEVEETRFPGGVCDECGRGLEGRICLITVSDTGTGMPEEILKKITEPFFTTKGVGRGTGLGLSVTQGIILSHNGHLHIASEPGKGTCVKIFLPIDDDAALDERVSEEKPPGGGETILVVDDEINLLQLAGKLLAKNGYKPLLAENGEKALDIYRNAGDEIAVVVLDLMMPGMNGAEVNRKLKETNPDVKVLFASGYSEDGVAETLMKDKNRRFLQKPLDIITLCRAIREMIDVGE